MVPQPPRPDRSNEILTLSVDYELLRQAQGSSTFSLTSNYPVGSQFENRKQRRAREALARRG